MTKSANLAAVGANANSGGTLITSGTAQASTSGTSITFTGIPSWAKRITVMFNGVSTSGTSNLLVQLGSGSTTTSGYTETNSSIKNGVSPGVGTVTNGFVIGSAILASSLNSGQTVFTNISSNIWTCSSQLADSVQPSLSYCAGVISLAGALDRVVITTVNGTDTFDAGSINILYE